MICFVMVITPKFREIPSYYYGKIANIKQLAKSITDKKHGLILSYELYKPVMREEEVKKGRDMTQMFDKVIISHADGLKFEPNVRHEIEALGIDIFNGAVPSYFWKGD